MQHKTTQEDILNWLLARGITLEAIKKNEIRWLEKGERIVIPVFDSTGRILFNKYRRNPFSDNEEPKYRYDAGATTALYGVHNELTSPVFICEGELDCILLNSLGLSAVSSTGGAGTFLREWVNLLKEKDIFICLDSDEAGVRGSIKIQQKFPQAKWVAIPPEHAKDVTEYIQKFGVKGFLDLTETAISYDIPEEDFSDNGHGHDTKTIRDTKNRFRDACNEIVLKQRNDGRKHLEMIRIFLLDKFSHYSTWLKKFGHIKPRGDDKEALRHIPITNFINFNQNGFAKCLWHQDDNASLKYYGPDAKYPNTAHCFGACQRSYDIFDVVMKIENMKFPEAIKRLQKL